MKKVDFRNLLEENKQVISKICRIYAHDNAEFDDYFQEVSLQIWKSYDSFQGKSKLSTWIYRIALNVCLSEIRKSNRKPQTTEIREGFDMADPVQEDKQEQVSRLYAAIKTLKKTDRAIILLYLEEKSYKEMAEILGITVSNIGVKVNRVKQELKQKLNG